METPEGLPPGPELLELVEAELLGGAPQFTREEVAAQAGLSLDLAQELWRSLGFAQSADDEVAFTEADVLALKGTKRLIEFGILDEQSQAALVRTWGRSYSRLASWQMELLVSLTRDSEDPQRAMETISHEVLPLVDSLQSYVWRRHLLSAAGRMLLGPGGESAVRAIGFVDIVGYTTQSRNLSQHDLVDLVEHFEDVAAGTITDAGGQLIKTIGDEVLYVVDDPADALRTAITLVARSTDDDHFPDVRAGVAYGNVVDRLGDVFGPTVNLASRLTGIARPGTVLVDRGVHEALQEAEEFEFRRVRRASVKGYHRLESWRAHTTDK